MENKKLSPASEGIKALKYDMGVLSPGESGELGLLDEMLANEKKGDAENDSK